MFTTVRRYAVNIDVDGRSWPTAQLADHLSRDARPVFVRAEHDKVSEGHVTLLSESLPDVAALVCARLRARKLCPKRAGHVAESKGPNADLERRVCAWRVRLAPSWSATRAQRSHRQSTSICERSFHWSFSSATADPYRPGSVPITRRGRAVSRSTAPVRHLVPPYSSLPSCLTSNSWPVMPTPGWRCAPPRQSPLVFRSGRVGAALRWRFRVGCFWPATAFTICITCNSCRRRRSCWPCVPRAPGARGVEAYVYRPGLCSSFERIYWASIARRVSPSAVARGGPA